MLVNRIRGGFGEPERMTVRQEISDEPWAVLEPLFPVWKGNGRPILDMRRTLEGIARRFRTGAPWRDIPERFGNWNSVYSRFSDWSKDGNRSRVLTTVRAASHRSGDLDWAVSVDSTIIGVHQHGATLARDIGGPTELQGTGHPGAR
jgi:transposase